MKTEINVRQADLTIRTVKLTKALLKQLRVLDSHNMPSNWKSISGAFNPERVVGWIHGSVLGDEFTRYTLLKGDDGDYFLCAWAEEKKYKQIYVS